MKTDLPLILVSGISAGAAGTAGGSADPFFVFPILLIYSIIIIVAMGFPASICFRTMEQSVW